MDMNWTDEMVETASRMWVSGFSARNIGSQLGVSRNSVIGKMSRLGVRSGKSPKPVPGPVREERQRIEWTGEMLATLERLWSEDYPAATIGAVLGVGKGSVFAKSRRLGLGSRGLRGRNRKSKSRKARILAPVKRDELSVEDEPDSFGLEFVELTAANCRWPHGDPADDDFGFCGHGCDVTRPYCSYHMEVSRP